MALGSREVLLLIRARDEASRVLAGLGANMAAVDAETKKNAASTRAHGAALTTLGAVSAVVGTKLAGFYYNSAKAAVQYNLEAARTLTQVDQVGVKTSDLVKIAEQVGNKVPASFDDMQSSLYDIFSSMSVNTKQAQHLLTVFSQASVAGQYNLQGAARGTIGIMNAFGLKVSQVAHVEDVMFQLTKEGVGTYGDFASAIGRATPSAVRAGQSYEELAGMMAFLTRNGLTAANASASAARALDSMSNPKTVAHFKDLGINVKNAQGEFKPMTQIVQELSDKLKGMTAPERSEALYNLFKSSGGTIQALRFWNVAVRQTGQYTKLTSDMTTKSAGAMEKAYKIMFKQPQTQMQLFSNQWKILRLNLGEAFIPVVTKLIQVFGKLFSWFNNLSPQTKKFIAIFGMAVAAVLILGGAIMTVVGTMLIFEAAAVAAGTSLVAVMGIIGVVIAVVAALGVAAYFIYKYWTPIKTFFLGLWKDVKGYFMDAYDWVVKNTMGWAKSFEGIIKSMWDWLVPSTSGAWSATVGAFSTAYDDVIGATKTFWGWIKSAWSASINVIKNFFSPLTTWFQNHWSEILQVWSVAETQITDMSKIFWAGLVALFTVSWAIIKSTAIVTWDVLKAIFMVGFQVLWTLCKVYWQYIVGVFKVSWDIITGVLSIGWTSIKTIFMVAFAVLLALVKVSWAAITAVFKVAWAAIVLVVKLAWNIISNLVKIAFNILALIFGVGLDLITGHWNKAWQDIRKYGLAVFNDFISIFKGTWNAFKGFFVTVLNAFKSFVTSTWSTIWNTAKYVFQTVMGAIETIFKTFWSHLKSAASDGWGAVKKIVVTGVNGFKTTWSTAWNSVKKTFTDVWNGIQSVASSVWGGIKGIFVAGVNEVIDTLNWFIKAINKIPGLPDIPTIGKLSTGNNRKSGPVNKYNANKQFATGGRWGSGQWALVGERGPELLQLTSGVAQVYNNQRTRKMMQDFNVGMGSLPKYGLGGIISDVTHSVTHIAKTTAHLVSQGAKIAAKEAFKPADAALNYAMGKFMPHGSMFVGVAKNIAGKIKTSVLKELEKVFGIGGGGKGGKGDMSAHSASAAAAQAYAKSLLGQFGWGASQMSALISLWNGESGWNNLAANPTSTAFGIAQFLNSTWGAYGPKTTDYRKQVLYGMQYIKNSYGNPAAAWAAWNSRSPHWYKNGINAIFSRPTLIGVGEAGAEHVQVTPRGKPGFGSSGTTQTINVYTQEINPIKHAADLGWELMRRVS